MKFPESDYPVTQDAIAARFGITKQRVGQIVEESTRRIWRNQVFARRQFQRLMLAAYAVALGMSLEPYRARRVRAKAGRPRQRILCSVPECGQVHRARGYCRLHYYRLFRVRPAPTGRKRGTPIRYCTVPGCDARRKGDGLCNRHYLQRRKSVAA